MRYHALACDYDATLAEDGTVSDAALSAIEGLRASGRRFVLVTGRELQDLLHVFPGAGACDRIVAENGALLFDPTTGRERALGEPPPAGFVEMLARRRVTPLTTGRVLVATREPHESDVLESIRELGLELQVIFNKGAVMVLPSGTNKATGLQAALDDLGLSFHEVAAVGDAENDHAMLSACECAVAVADALPALRAHADLVTAGGAGAGVVELIERLLRSDLAELEPRLARHRVQLGWDARGEPLRIAPYGTRLLVAGTSRAARAALARALLEGLVVRGYQTCAIDTSGEGPHLPDTVVIEGAPHEAELLQVLGHPRDHAAVDLGSVPESERRLALESMLRALVAHRARRGRPHWLVFCGAREIDIEWLEHVPSHGVAWIVTHPGELPPAVLSSVDAIVAGGDTAPETLHAFCAATGAAELRIPTDQPGFASAGALFWDRRSPAVPSWFRVGAPSGR